MDVRKSAAVMIFLAAAACTASAQRVAGYVNDSGVRVRDRPGLDGGILGTLDRENRVEVLDISENRMKIDGMNSYWYKIRTGARISGWAYGHFVSMRREDLLVLAVFLGRQDIVIDLIREGAKVNEVFKETGMDFGNEYFLEAPPLAFAVKSRSLEIAEILLNAGADPNANWIYSEPGGDIVKTVLSLAVDAGAAGIAGLLIKSGADVEETSYFASSPGGLGVVTPLIAAAAAGSAEMVRILVSAGADPGRVLRYEPAYGEPVSVSALSAAAGSGYNDIAEYLKSAGAQE